ncbi:hypothetical protein [Aestuariibaculum lutulentum]|uniref:Lipoprotein n=1 Tax=Aestuariibaculum lutulentum TaxID=2920935 RepID=A0ABS9RPK5_9FLAO|nr:hypothetical protein [Aestuariibaculum lutulentum]MCH4554119.1 hypothetical protein [Aestuariibaculum lutulentum]
MNKINIKLIYILLIFTSCASTQNLTKNQAIEIAESYVIEQGYSDKIIDLKKTKIDSDILDQYQTPEKIAELRHNLLNSKAVYSKKTENGWIIGFEYKNEKFNEIQDGIRFGKGVLILENGKEIKMFHENIRFE